MSHKNGSFWDHRFFFAFIIQEPFIITINIKIQFCDSPVKRQGRINDARFDHNVFILQHIHSFFDERIRGKIFYNIRRKNHNVGRSSGVLNDPFPKFPKKNHRIHRGNRPLFISRQDDNIIKTKVDLNVNAFFFVHDVDFSFKKNLPAHPLFSSGDRFFQVCHILRQKFVFAFFRRPLRIDIFSDRAFGNIVDCQHSFRRDLRRSELIRPESLARDNLSAFSGTYKRRHDSFPFADVKFHLFGYVRLFAREKGFL